jgi:hypothetical protein
MTRLPHGDQAILDIRKKQWKWQRMPGETSGVWMWRSSDMRRALW